MENKAEKYRSPLGKMVHFLCNTYAHGVEGAANYVGQNYLSDTELKNSLEEIYQLYTSEDLEKEGQAHNKFQDLLESIQGKLDNNS